MRWELSKEWRRALAKRAENSIVIEQQDGSTAVFPANESLLLEFVVGYWGEETESSNPQLRRLEEALDNATPESREEFYATFTPFPVWEQEVRLRNADNEGAKEE